MASPQAEAVKDALRAFREQAIGTGPQPDLAEQRAAMDAWRDLATEPAGTTVTEVDAGGVASQWVSTPGAVQDRALVYLHGGGYVLGSAHTHSRLAAHLGAAVGCRVLNVDYRLAPEHPHPAAVHDATAAYRWLLDGGYQANHLAIAGDSAGGGLTVATLVNLRDQGVAQPAGGVPLSPWIDLEGTGASMDTKADADVVVGRDGLKVMSDHFLAGHDPRDPLAAPLHADLTGLAPLYVQVGADETLLDDALRLAANAAAAGVEVRLDSFPEMQHVFQGMAGNAPEADEAIARIGTWLRPRLGF